VRVDADQKHFGVQAVFGEDAFVNCDHRRRAVTGRRAADGHLGLGESRATPQEGDCAQTERDETWSEFWPKTHGLSSQFGLLATSACISTKIKIIYFFLVQGRKVLKLATFRRGATARIGIIHAGDARVFDVAAAAERDGAVNPAFTSMLALIDADDAGMAATRDLQAGRGAQALSAKREGGEAAFNKVMAGPLGELAPVYRQVPIYYLTNRMIVRGPDAVIAWPRYSKVMDYELELGIVTKRTRANIPANEAAAHIFGYTIFNDFSARDAQARE